jgi:hypothetical protein
MALLKLFADCLGVSASVQMGDDGKLHIAKGLHDKSALAWATYQATTDSNGWDILDLTTSSHPKYSEDEKFRAAGFLEGALSVFA